MSSGRHDKSRDLLFYRKKSARLQSENTAEKYPAILKTKHQTASFYNLFHGVPRWFNNIILQSVCQ